MPVNALFIFVSAYCHITLEKSGVDLTLTREEMKEKYAPEMWEMLAEYVKEPTMFHLDEVEIY